VGLTGPISGTVGLTGPVSLNEGTLVGLTGPISGTVGLTGPVSLNEGTLVGLTGPTEAHMYASSNGSTWHHLASDSNGVLNIHSRLQDGEGNDITSTLNNNKRSLDTVINNTITVNTQKDTATIFNIYSGAISGSYLGATDLNGYSSFDLLVNQPANGVSNPGSLYVAISDNNTDWYITTYSVYLNNDVVNNRTYTISFPSLNTRYVCITGTNPYGGSATATLYTNVKISAKK
jgi:hypothetical protein